MAINEWVADFLARGLAIGAFPPGGDLAEFGESAIAAHSDISALFGTVAPLVPEARLAEALRQLAQSRDSISHYRHDAGPARAFYHAVFAPRCYLAIEMGIAPRRLCVDLNGPLEVDRSFDYVINNATCQHVFDQANFYRAMHDLTRPGGVMIHWTPTIGWLNHGLYTIQPGFFFDLAAANDYGIRLAGLMSDGVFFPIMDGEGYREGLARHPELSQSVIGVVLEKRTNQPFRPPMQNAFRDGIPEQYLLARKPRRYARDSRVNLALDKPSLQSSTGRGSWDDDPALDAAGGNNGFITGYYSFCTDLQAEPWWMVDLGAAVPIQEVVVYNRIDAFPDGAELSANLQISLSQDGLNWSRVFQREDDRPFGGADGEPLRVLIYNRIARFVRLSLPGTTILCLDEIEVY